MRQLRDNRNSLVNPLGGAVAITDGHPTTDVLARWLIIQSNAGESASTTFGGNTVTATEATRRGILLKSAASKECRPLLILRSVNLGNAYATPSADSKGVHYVYPESE